MRFKSTAIALAMATAIAFSASVARADWYDGGLIGMQYKAVDWVAELWVCGWGGC